MIRATDEDSGNNKILEYSFVDGNELGNFFIDMNSGRITVMKKIDRDPPRNQTTFNITVSTKSEMVVLENMFFKRHKSPCRSWQRIKATPLLILQCRFV